MAQNVFAQKLEKGQRSRTVVGKGADHGCRPYRSGSATALRESVSYDHNRPRLRRSPDA